MLTTNLDVTDQLTDGAMGTVTGVALKQNGTLHVILVHFDSDRIGSGTKSNSKYKHIDSNSVPIERIEMPFSLAKQHVRVSQTQFPLILCWAVTIHKCQGMTLPEIVVDMSHEKGRFKDGQAYVAFSHVTALDKLYIINYTHEQIHVSQKVENEMNCEDRSMLPVLPSPLISKIDNNSNVVLVHLNVSGLCSKLLDIKCDTLLKYADILCFNETHLCSKHSFRPEMLGFDDNYIIFRQDRNERGGGVMVLVQKHFHPQCILTASNIEAVVVQTDTETGPLQVISVYRSQKYIHDIWIGEIKNLFNLYQEKKVCVIGDMNEDILDTAFKSIQSMFMSHGFVQHISTPTRDSGILINHVYTLNIGDSDVKTEVLDCYYSDHDTVTCQLTCAK